LRAIIFDKNVIEKWSKDTIPFVQRIINASVDSSIGVAPSQILYGNAINLDRGIFLPLHNVNNNQYAQLSEWSDKMLKTQNAVIEAAQNSQRSKDENHIAQFDAKRSEFLPDSYVLVDYPLSSMKKGPPNKLMSKYKGPLKVVSNIGNTYTVENLLTHKLETYHITQLRKFNYEPERTDPKDIAIKSQQESIVESILEHSGNRTEKREMEFKVRWLGEPKENDLWLPWKSLKDNPALHKYLSENKLKSLIPAEHKIKKSKSD